MPNEFLDYVEQVEENVKDQAMYAAHSKWQQETWTGRLTLAILEIGKNPLVRKFMDIVLDLSTGDQSKGNAWARRLLKIGLLILIALVTMTLFTIAGKFMSKEIVLNQEVQIVEEVKLSDLLKEDSDATNDKDIDNSTNNNNSDAINEKVATNGRRSARERKHKSA